MLARPALCLFFFFNDTATTEIYTLSLHDALPISAVGVTGRRIHRLLRIQVHLQLLAAHHGYSDRKSTRLNSSHSQISYAVFCLKKKTKKTHLQNILSRVDRNERRVVLLLHTQREL